MPAKSTEDFLSLRKKPYTGRQLVPRQALEFYGHCRVLEIKRIVRSQNGLPGVRNPILILANERSVPWS